MASIRDNLYAHEIAGNSFAPDNDRGKWSSKWSFYIAAISQGFSSWHFYNNLNDPDGGVFLIIPYILGMMLFILPLTFIQSSLGQFSNTGFISLFRMAPLFKGIGYVACFVNIFFILMQSVSSLYSLTYLFGSLIPHHPWLSCNHTWNSPDCIEIKKNDKWYAANYENYIFWSTNEYFEKLFFGKDALIFFYFLGSIIFFWSLITTTMFNGIKSFSKVISLTGSIPLVILVIFFIRACFLPDSTEILKQYLIPKQKSSITFSYLFESLQLIQMSFGTGWGGMITLASFNDFRTDVNKYSFYICGFHIIITIISALLMFLIHNSTKGKFLFIPYYLYDDPRKYLFVPYPYFFETLELSNMWMILYSLMMFLLQFNAVVIPVFVTITSLFDDFKSFRKYKKWITLGSCSFLFLISTIFTIDMLEWENSMPSLLLQSFTINQLALCVFELFAILWIYGRLRFQRDAEFMLNKPISKIIKFLIHFVLPFFIIYMVYSLIAMFNKRNWPSREIVRDIIECFALLIPWIIILGYFACKWLAMTGPFLTRIKQSIKPSDWYPADLRHQRNYNEFIGNSFDVTYQLAEFDRDLRNT